MSIFGLFGKKQEDEGAIQAQSGGEERKKAEDRPAGSVLADWFRREDYLSLLESLSGKRHVTVGLFGDERAGKTVTLSALERCMTGENRLWELWLQTPAEENPVKYVALRYHDCSFLFSDFPGDPVSSEDLKAMGDAALKTDAALLVMSEEGLTPGLARHMELIRAAGIPDVILFRNKTDKDGAPEALEQAELQAKSALEALGLSFRGGPVPIVRGSALQAAQDVASPWAEQLLELAALVEQCAHE